LLASDQASENHHQEPLGFLPDAGILALPISRDVQSLDLGILTQPLNYIRRQDASVRFNQEHGLARTSHASNVAFAPAESVLPNQMVPSDS
jgi:hypothetical protein